MFRDKIMQVWQGSTTEKLAPTENPAGAIELTDEELDQAAGGHGGWRRRVVHHRMHRPSRGHGYGYGHGYCPPRRRHW